MTEGVGKISKRRPNTWKGGTVATTDLRAVWVALAITVVGVFGEVGWPLIYLGAGLVLTVAAMGICVDCRFDIRPFEVVSWTVICWGVVAALLVSGGALASKTTLATWGGAMVIWAVVARSRRRGRRLVLIIMLWGAGLLGAAVIVSFWGVPQLIINHNISVALMVSVIPLALEISQASWKARWAVALMLIPTLLTGSRAGVLAVLVIVISLWPEGRSRRWAIAMGGAGAIAAIAWRVISRPESLAWYRWRIWGAVVESIGDRPWWGIGAGNVAEAMGPYRLEHTTELGRWGHVIGGAESLPLGLAARVGLPALILASVALGLWFFRSRRPAPTTTATLGAIIVMGLFHDFWSEPAVLWWWAAVLGLLTIRYWESPECRRSGSGFNRWPAALVVGGLVAWALVQPAWAQWLWWHSEPLPGAVVKAIRAEPWFSQPMEWRVENLLEEPQWSWAQASEALEWSRRSLEIQPGSARTWSLHGRVNARIVGEFGVWPETVENARTAFGQASTLEPRLPWHPYSLAMMERSLGNLERALRLASHSVELEPAFVRGWLLVSRLELDGGNLEAARHAFESSLVIRDTNEPRVWIGYHHDLIRCPEWQVEALKQELKMSNDE